MTERKNTEMIEPGNDPSLAWDIRRAAAKLEDLLCYTPQYAEVLKAVRELTATNIKVTDEQQRCYANNERIARDIIRKVLEREKELITLGQREEELRQMRIPQYNDHLIHVVTKEGDE